MIRAHYGHHNKEIKNESDKKKVLVQAPARANPVARHARKFNRSAAFQNRKKGC